MSRIMVVDDDEDILKYCDMILAARGHEVVLASDPQQAINILSTHPVDLLVVDIVFPRFTGFDLLKSVKRLKNFHAPIVMLTGRSTTKDVRTALELGATDYMCKPLDRDIFVAKVESVIGTLAQAQPLVPEVSFATGSTAAKAELTLSAVVVAVSEMGMTLRTRSYVDRGSRVKVDSPIFGEIGIPVPYLRAAKCRPIERDIEFLYEVFVSFIGLEETSMRRIRQWIATRHVQSRKAG